MDGIDNVIFNVCVCDNVFLSLCLSHGVCLVYNVSTVYVYVILFLLYVKPIKH